MATNYYTVLGLPQNATSRQIRQRFLELAREGHPDRFQGEKEKAAAEERFQEVTLAFNVLNDPSRRREHDTALLTPSAHDNKGDASKVYLQRGIKAYRQNSYGEASENFEAAVREDASNAKAWYYLAAAGRHIARLRSKAVLAAKRACELEPMKVDYLKLAGALCAKEGDVARAEKYLQSALDWGGEDPEVAEALAELRSSGKKGKTGFFG